jgi:hypothetical protein
MSASQTEQLFHAIFQATDGVELDSVVAGALALNQISWHPLGGDENCFGVIENQQASPIAALIEKVTNAIDAILMRRCLERGKRAKGMLDLPTVGAYD